MILWYIGFSNCESPYLFIFLVLVLNDDMNMNNEKFEITRNNLFAL